MSRRLWRVTAVDEEAAVDVYKRYSHGGFFCMVRRAARFAQGWLSAWSNVYKRQGVARYVGR